MKFACAVSRTKMRREAGAGRDVFADLNIVGWLCAGVSWLEGVVG